MMPTQLKYKVAIIIGIMLIIAMIHAFRVGTYLNGQLYIYYYSYFSDIIIPFGMYYLLCINEFSIAFLRKWFVKALLVFGVATFTEIMQAFGIPLLGSTFDPLDIVMFGIGVIAAVTVEKLIFERVFSFWKIPNNSGKVD